MIKISRGKVVVKAKSDCQLIAEFMCIMSFISSQIIIPTHGKENLKTELYKMVDVVCKTVLEREAD